MIRGLYSFKCETTLGKAVGVAHFVDGKIRGGNSTCAYLGSYTMSGNLVSGTVKSTRHTDDLKTAPVFDLDTIEIDFDGVVGDGRAMIEGVPRELPTMMMKALLTRVTE